MDPLPIQCRARYEEIEKRAVSLSNNLINGNKGDVLEALLEMEPKAAFAVLTEAMLLLDTEGRYSLHGFLKEVA